MGAFRFGVRKTLKAMGKRRARDVEIVQAGWCISVISTLNRQSQEGHEFKTSLGSRVRSMRKLWGSIEKKGKKEGGRDRQTLG